MQVFLKILSQPNSAEITYCIFIVYCLEINHMLCKQEIRTICSEGQPQFGKTHGSEGKESA